MAAYGLQRLFHRAHGMILRPLLGLCACCFLAWPCCAAEPDAGKPALQDRVISSSLKLMAKTYVLTADLEKLKKKQIARIRAADDEEFRLAFAQTLGVVEQSPELRSHFGIDPAMDREEAIGVINGLNKDRLCKMIDAVPDSVVAGRFRGFMAKRMDEMKGMDLTQRISHVWNSFRQRIEK